MTKRIRLAVLLVAAWGLAASAFGGGSASHHPEEEKIRRIVVAPEGVVEIETGDAVLENLNRHGFLGVKIVGLTGQLREHYGSGERGVLVSAVVEESAAEKAGLRAGDIIVEIDGRDVKGAGDITHALRDWEEGRVTEIRFVRDGVEQYTTAVPEIRKKLHRLRIDAPGLDRLRERVIWNDGEEMSLKELEEKLEVELEKVGEGVFDSMENLRVFFDSPEWKERAISIRDCSEAQKDIERLTKRIRELEKKLADR